MFAVKELKVNSLTSEIGICVWDNNLNVVHSAVKASARGHDKLVYIYSYFPAFFTINSYKNDEIARFLVVFARASSTSLRRSYHKTSSKRWLF